MTTLPADELVERVRRIADQMERFLGPPEMAPGPDPDDLTDAVDLIEAQAAEISSLRAKLAEAMEVLEPIAECADEGNEDQPDDTKCEVKAGRSICYFLTLANFRAARRLIEGNGNG